MLHYWNDSWPLSLHDCPCDAHFVELMEERGVKGASIFHFGTGNHHHVGVRLAENASGNAVLGITAAPKEHEAYVRLVIERPRVGHTYKCLFGDIYQLDRRLLPEFDWVTLFHLCEYRTEKNDAYGALTDRELLRLFIDRLRPGGMLLFFPRSYAWKDAAPIVAEADGEGLIRPAGEYKSLLLYRRI